MRNNLLIFMVVLMLFNTISFGAGVYAPGKDKGFIYEVYAWPGALGDHSGPCLNTLEDDNGQHYAIFERHQAINPGINPDCRVSELRNHLESHNYGVVWIHSHSSNAGFSTEPYIKTTAGKAARDNAFATYLGQPGYTNFTIYKGENAHSWNIGIRKVGVEQWFRDNSTLDSALVFCKGCYSAFFNTSWGAGVAVGYDHSYTGMEDCDIFWERMNGEHGVNLRAVSTAVAELANGHMLYNPNMNPYLDIKLTPYVKMTTFGPNETSGSVYFDISMNTTQYDPEDIISVTGADIVNANWSYYDTKLNFEIGNVTQNTQNYTVHHDKAIAKNLVTTTRLDGNQNPPGTNGHGPNCDDYKFIGHAQTGIVEAESAFESGFTTCLKTLSPNPGYGKIDINYQIANPTATKITIFDCSGRIVKSIEINDDHGNHTVIWDGVDTQGREVTNGCYFVKFEANDYKVIKKLILIK